jgi:hypothetical protein
MAASNSAEVEKLALGAGMKKGGAAKGELVLAMYELANSFRNGWGIKKDPAAAKQYYETAANLGDTDAMNEVAWCYTEGFGTKKDKVSKTCRLSLLVIFRSGEWARQVDRSRVISTETQTLPLSRLIIWAAFWCSADADDANCASLVQSGSVPAPRRVQGK